MRVHRLRKWGVAALKRNFYFIFFLLYCQQVNVFLSTDIFPAALVATNTHCKHVPNLGHFHDHLCSINETSTKLTRYADALASRLNQFQT